jgi:hypothetical protein
MCKAMNQAELKALLLIVKKLGWNDKPALEAIETIQQMVRNQQSLELDTIGECDDFEETLLSMAHWDAEKVFSTMLVSDYQSLCDYHQNYKGLKFLEDMGLGSYADITAMIQYYETAEPEPDPIHDYNEWLEAYIADDYDYFLECSQDAMWITNNC